MELFLRKMYSIKTDEPFSIMHFASTKVSSISSNKVAQVPIFSPGCEHTNHLICKAIILGLSKDMQVTASLCKL